MADSSDVEIALREVVQGVRNTSFPGVPVVRGWPSDEDLSAVAAAGGTLVAVVQRPGNYVRNSSRYLDNEAVVSVVPPSITVTMLNDTATFAGTGDTDQLAGVKATSGEWSVRCLAGETAASVAARLAVLSGGTANGAALTVAGLVSALTERDAPVVTMTRQQAIQFAVFIWTPDPLKRDSIASAIDSVISGMTHLSLSDGAANEIKWAGTTPSDKAREQGLYHRELAYLVDFSTTQTTVWPRVLFPDFVYTAA